MFKRKRVGVIGLVVGLLLGGALPMVQAATLQALWVEVGTIGPTCDTTGFLIFTTITGTVEDVPGIDYVGMTITDAAGVPLAAYTGTFNLGAATAPAFYEPGDRMSPVTVRPVTAKLFDITAFAGYHTQAAYDAISAGTLLGQVVFDPADYAPVCASLPLVVPSAAVPGCDVQMNITSTSVVGAFVADAPVYSEPGVLASPAVTLQTGKTAWVLGQDATGQYYKIVWSCDYLWVPVGTMGPNPDAVWRNTPLPTQVVS